MFRGSLTSRKIPLPRISGYKLRIRYNLKTILKTDKWKIITNPCFLILNGNFYKTQQNNHKSWFFNLIFNGIFINVHIESVFKLGLSKPNFEDCNKKSLVLGDYMRYVIGAGWRRNMIIFK